MFTTQTILVAVLGGILPPLLWLFFWLREDRLHPEPKKYILRSFIFGMIAVLIAIPFERFTYGLFAGAGLVLLSWSFIEEILKYIGAYFGGLYTKALDEPIDAVIYLVTAALGFSALENIFFLLNPAAGGSLALGLVTTNIRFIGATLLHTVASGTIGVAMALSFYKGRGAKILYWTVGMLIAIGLHALFNYFILEKGGGSLLTIFAFVWLAVILLILFFEKIKRIRRSKVRV